MADSACYAGLVKRKIWRFSFFVERKCFYNYKISLIQKASSDMYQQQVPQPRDEREWSGSSPEAEYEAGYTGTPPQQTNQLADAIARRLQAQAPSSLQASPFQPRQNPLVASAAQRLALAIVSVAVLVPLAAISLGILKTEGLISLGVVGAVILGINYLFNSHKP